jgi:hypothetical protein
LQRSRRHSAASRAVHCWPTRAAVRPTRRPELYLKGRYFYFNRNAVNLGRAIEFYRAAVAKDPAFARAHARLALTYSLFRIYLPDPSIRRHD